MSLVPGVNTFTLRNKMKSVAECDEWKISNTKLNINENTFNIQITTMNRILKFVLVVASLSLCEGRLKQAEHCKHQVLQ